MRKCYPRNNSSPNSDGWFNLNYKNKLVKPYQSIIFTINQALLGATKKLEKTSPSARLDAEVLLAYVLGKNREFILTYPEKLISKIQNARYEILVERRVKNEPIAYITSHKEFYGLDFKVTRDTLIPRPETEMLVELASHSLEHKAWSKKNIHILDVGTGSGNIIISIAKNIWTPDVHYGHRMSFYGIDISAKALLIAKLNAKNNKVHKKIIFLKGDLLDPILKNKTCSMFHAPCFMIIIANLPYLSQKIYSSAMPDVKKFEPRSALLSKNDGFYHYENLFKQIKTLKKRGSMLHVICYVEFSPEQKPRINKLIQQRFPKSKIKFTKDLAGKWRVAQFSI